MHPIFLSLNVRLLLPRRAGSTEARDEADSKPAHAKPAYAAPRILLVFIVCATRLGQRQNQIFFGRGYLVEKIGNAIEASRPALSVRYARGVTRKTGLRQDNFRGAALLEKLNGYKRLPGSSYAFSRQ